MKVFCYLTTLQKSYLFFFITALDIICQAVCILPGIQNSCDTIFKCCTCGNVKKHISCVLTCHDLLPDLEVWIHVWKKAHQIWKHVIHILWCTIHMWKSHSYVCETNVRSTCRTVLFFSVSNSSRETFSWRDINVFIPPYLSGRGHVAPRIYCMINVIRREGSRKERRRKKQTLSFMSSTDFTT